MMNKIFLSLVFLYSAISSVAQKESFDIASFSPPDGWTKELKEDFVSFSRIDGASWSQIAVYKSRQSSGNIEEDALKNWQDIVLAGHTIENEDKTTSKPAEGWQVMSHSGVWQYNSTNVATLLTTYSNGNICISVLWNGTAKPYMQNLKDFIASIDLDVNATPVQQKDTGNNEGNSNQNTTNSNGETTSSSSSSIVGAWINNFREDRGFINGYRMYTGGYMKKEYVFKEDGSYIFRQKDWLASRDNIYFVYETGKWVVNGNQLTITPDKGKAGWWNKDKIGNTTDKWGAYQKAAKYILEKTTYTFELQISDYGRNLLLNYSKATERDGDHPAGNGQYTSYHFDKGKSIINNPPGLITGFENKVLPKRGN